MTFSSPWLPDLSQSVINITQKRVLFISSVNIVHQWDWSAFYFYLHSKLWSLKKHKSESKLIHWYIVWLIRCMDMDKKYILFICFQVWSSQFNPGQHKKNVVNPNFERNPIHILKAKLLVQVRNFWFRSSNKSCCQDCTNFCIFWYRYSKVI